MSRNHGGICKGSNRSPLYSYWQVQPSNVSQAALRGKMRSSVVGRRHLICVSSASHQLRSRVAGKAPFRCATKVRRCSSCSTDFQPALDCVTASGPVTPPLESGQAASVGSGGGVGLGLKMRLLVFFRRLGLVLFVARFRNRKWRRPRKILAGETLRLSGDVVHEGGMLPAARCIGYGRGKGYWGGGSGLDQLFRGMCWSWQGRVCPG
mmetsp:Transcript_16232/g.44697  ORF Transcript_16232/g.44697 Transcript_16232/m.44697 type:complete len:208 (-) Transcript_16232:299-922(-)